MDIYIDKTNWVINLTSRSLNNAKRALLQKGLNYAITPAEQADTIRRAVNNILQQGELPEPSITKEMQDTLKHLKEDEFIMVLSADKGRASVDMDTDTYHIKMSTLIENGPYQLLNKDPTDCLTQMLSKKLQTLK